MSSSSSSFSSSVSSVSLTSQTVTQPPLSPIYEPGTEEVITQQLQLPDEPLTSAPQSPVESEPGAEPGGVPRSFSEGL